MQVIFKDMRRIWVVQSSLFISLHLQLEAKLVHQIAFDINDNSILLPELVEAAVANNKDESHDHNRHRITVDPRKYSYRHYSLQLFLKH